MKDLWLSGHIHFIVFGFVGVQIFVVTKDNSHAE